ncbi:MAG: RHS repeat-associated core domain-containing protein, partial [Helicobacteraceae bacterium]|nr:RHS repeat-associated core domain-containing protein [Helicobacteraceae bacterium]
IKRIDYDSFGNILSQSNPTPSVTALDNLDIPIGFGGGLYDRDTNLIRFGYRDYDPFIGRWTAKDPIDFMGGQGNLYVYVGNDPINYVDPTGEFWQVIIGGIIAYYLVDVILDTYEYLIQAKIKIDNPQGIGSPEHRDQLRGALDDTAGFCRENAPISPIGNPVRLIPLPKNEHNKLFDIGYEFGNDLMRNNQSQGNGKQ